MKLSICKKIAIIGTLICMGLVTWMMWTPLGKPHTEGIYSVKECLTATVTAWFIFGLGVVFARDLYKNHC